MIDKFPDEVYRSPAVQEALKAAASGDGVKAFRLLESNPTAKKEMLKYANKLGYEEVSAYKQSKLFNSPNPAEYVQRLDGSFYSRPKSTTKKAEGGLASLTKKQMSKA